MKKILFGLLLCWITTSQLFSQIGIHYTPQELAIWRNRAQFGPYRVQSDVSPNSPGSWAVIQKNADAFLLKPGTDTTNTATFALGYATEPKSGMLIRDAAFVALILKDSLTTKSQQYAQAVRGILLEQTNVTKHPETDFSKYTLFKDLAGWVLAEYVTKLLFSYDYIKDLGVLSSAEKIALNGWFYNAANFFARNTHVSLATLFPKRMENNYTVVTGPAQSGSADALQYTHVSATGAKFNAIKDLHEFYNNRRAAHILLVGLVDVFLKNIGYQVPQVNALAKGVSYTNPLEDHVKLYIKEWLKYSVFPDGMQGEYKRSSNKEPFDGYNYATINIFSACTLADAYARRGDFELYNYTTSEGLWGTQGGSKSIRMVVESQMSMVDGTAKRYFTIVDEPHRYNNIQTINNDNQIRHYVHDTWYVHSNRYWNSAYQKGVYTRTGPGTVPYPVLGSKTVFIGSAGGLLPWGGSGYIFPHLLFMYGQLEGKANPYLLAPTNLSAIGVSNTQINLAWTDNSTNESGFLLYRSNTPNGPFTLLASLPANTTTYSNTSLPYATTYYYKVTGFTTAQGEGAGTQVANGTTTTPAPTIYLPNSPNTFLGNILSNTRFDFTFKDNSSNETNFIVERKVGIGSWITFATLAANSTSFSDSTVALGNTYAYRVKAINLSGSSGYTTEVILSVNNNAVNFLTGLPADSIFASPAYTTPAISYGKEKAVDGLSDLDYRYVTTDVAGDKYWEAHLQGNKRVRKLIATFGWRDYIFPKSFKWQYWNGVAWVDAPGASTTTNTQKTRTFSVDITTQRIRLILLDGTQQGIEEISATDR